MGFVLVRTQGRETIKLSHKCCNSKKSRCGKRFKSLIYHLWLKGIARYNRSRFERVTTL